MRVPTNLSEAGTVVVLSGTGTDPDGTVVSYAWTQTGGATVTLAGAASADVAFTAPKVVEGATLTFRLTVTDDDGASGSDDVRVTVRSDVEGFVSVSLAPSYTCGLRGTGKIACWGRNRYGESTPPGGVFVSVGTGTSNARLRDTRHG